MTSPKERAGSESWGKEQQDEIWKQRPVWKNKKTLATYYSRLLSSCCILAPALLFWIPTASGCALTGQSETCDGPCRNNYAESCADIMARYDLKGDCCALSDATTDPASPGCRLTVTTGSCRLTERRENCQAPVWVKPEGSNLPFCCFVPSFTWFADESTASECPASQYDPVERSFQGSALFVEMELQGIDSMDYEQVLEWQRLSEQHTLSFFASDESAASLGITDLQTQVYGQMESIDGRIEKADPDSDFLEVTFRQYLNWRGNEEADVNGILDKAYNSPEGQAAYLALLQEQSDESVFSSVTEVTEVEENRPANQNTAAPAPASDSKSGIGLGMGKYQAVIMFWTIPLLMGLLY